MLDGIQEIQKQNLNDFLEIRELHFKDKNQLIEFTENEMENTKNAIRA